LAQTSTKLTWVFTLLIELRVSFTTPILLCDKQNVVSIAHMMFSEGKYYDQTVFHLSYSSLGSVGRCVDQATKPFSSARFAFLRGNLNVKSFSPEKFSP